MGICQTSGTRKFRIRIWSEPDSVSYDYELFHLPCDGIAIRPYDLQYKDSIMESEICGEEGDRLYLKIEHAEVFTPMFDFDSENAISCLCRVGSRSAGWTLTYPDSFFGEVALQEPSLFGFVKFWLRWDAACQVCDGDILPSSELTDIGLRCRREQGDF